MIETSRRGFITGLVALVAAPAIVRAGSLMPVKPFVDEAAITRAMQDYIERMVNPPLIAAWQDFILFGTGAMELDGQTIRHVPLEQLYVDRVEVQKIIGHALGLAPG